MLNAKKLSSNKIRELDDELFKTAVVFDTENIHTEVKKKKLFQQAGACLL